MSISAGGAVGDGGVHESGAVGAGTRADARGGEGDVRNEGKEEEIDENDPLWKVRT